MEADRVLTHSSYSGDKERLVQGHVIPRTALGLVASHFLYWTNNIYFLDAFKAGQLKVT